MSTKLALVCWLALACGGSSPSSSSSSDTTSSTTGGEHPSMPSLRPPGSQEELARLAASPSPDAYARASLFFAQTDLAGFGLLYGMTAVAMDPSGAFVGGVARSNADVLRRRLTSELDENGQRVGSIRLAPGGMPVQQGPHGPEATLSHLVELELGTSLSAIGEAWTFERVRGGFDTLVRGLINGQIPSFVELDAWLVTLARAGHLDGFLALTFGAGFPDEIPTYRAAADAARVWIAAHPFRPGRPARPDDWIPLPAR
ncbi:MAG: hypothetical protein R3B99_24610 [Polyangiales bacterium]|nr:hypothetical protein [Myxococcales bacterium]MCB9604760.1 hypothetical protein [Sandaracinus sp.]